MSDSVHKPKHYTEGRKHEPKDVIRDWDLNFNRGSAVKYIARAGRKEDELEDLEKAREFLTFEIDAIKAERSKEKEAKKVTFKHIPIGLYDKPLKISTGAKIKTPKEEKPEGKSVKCVRMTVNIPDHMNIDEVRKLILDRFEEALK